MSIDKNDAPPPPPPPPPPDYSIADEPVVDEGAAPPESSPIAQDSAGGTDETREPADTKMHIDGDAGESTLVSSLEQPEVKSGLEAAWQDSKADSYDARHEEGGWIIRNDATGQSRLERVGPGKRDGIAPGQPPALGTGERVEAFAHTHPNPKVDEIGNQYSQGPSNVDQAWAESHQIPVVVRAADGVHVYFPKSTG